VQEVVADTGYHSSEVVRQLAEAKVRTYIAEPDRGARQWEGRQQERSAVYANGRRVQGNRGKRLLAMRGQRIERNFAHQFDTGGLDRLWVRGLANVHKKLLIQTAACNLALLMRGRAKPKAAHEAPIDLVFTILGSQSFYQPSGRWKSPFLSRTLCVGPRITVGIVPQLNAENRLFRHALLRPEGRSSYWTRPRHIWMFSQ
jgi:hypothetical protein